MAGKRTATSDLNHDNWNQEDDPEERGTFQKASEGALKSRVIKTAKRRNPIRSEDGEKTSAFAGFTGFTSKPASTEKPESGDFSFLKNVSSNSSPNTNGVYTPKVIPTSVFNMFVNSNTQTELHNTNTTKNVGTVTTNVSASRNIFGASASISATNTINTIVPSGSSVNKKSDQYCAKLKGLNESVSKWIVKKVEENPLISLQPVFKDYEKYLGEIEEGESSVSNTDKAATNSYTTNSIPTFNFLPSADKNTKAIPDSTSEKVDKNEESPPTFKFGGPTASVSSSGPTYSFGAGGSASSSFTSSSTLSSALSTTPTFSFGSNNSGGSKLFPTSSGFSFGGAAKSVQPEKVKEDGDKGNENDEDEPPKVEFKPVVEKDHIYTIRCKVFVKKGDSFGDRGVGNLYLKPIEKSEKIQLIVRADTNLGNLLLNFILSESVPTKRTGKKDVLLVAIPMPDAQPPPVPLLLRVKSAEAADSLLEVLEKHKK